MSARRVPLAAQSGATEAEIERAREQGEASARADIREGVIRWPYEKCTGLAGKHLEVHMAWIESKRRTLEAAGYVRGGTK